MPNTSMGAGTAERPVPQWPQQRTADETRAAAAGPPSRVENRTDAPDSTPPRPDGPARMLGRDELSGAEQAARDAGHRVIDTSLGRTDGLTKCPSCGSSEIAYSITARALVCSYCRHSFNEAVAERAFGLDSPIDQLRGTTIASGSVDIQDDTATVVTLKCQGCGAEVVIPVQETLQARCHWCRQTLSVNTQVPNGAVPDALLPFLLTRDDAVERIRAFVGERRTFALSRFKDEFVPENVIGVYIPYMVVDGNLHAELRGRGEIQTRQYTVRRKRGDDYVTETYYDADVYAIARSFDMLVDDLAVESASRYDARDNSASTNNILNAVQPYDIENAFAFNPNYLKGFNSERRDVNIDDLDERIEDKFLAVARAKALPTISAYDRGVEWTEEGVAVRGSRWVSVAVPVWLYSYADSAKGPGSLVHYIAVNGRTGSTMGSVPVSHPKIAALACSVGAVVTAVTGVIAAMVFLAG